MTRLSRALISLCLLAGCSGGGSGEEPAATHSRANDPAPATPTEFLVATSAGLWRGLTNGQGGIVFERAGLHQLALFDHVRLAQGLVYYPREAPSIFFDYPNQDIWTVRADGTGDHAVLNTTANEFVLDAEGPVAIYEQGTYTLANGLDRTDFGSINNGTPLVTLPIRERFTGYRFMSEGRAYFNNEQQIFSVTPSGAGFTVDATVRFPVTLNAVDAFDNRVVFRTSNGANGTTQLFAAPIGGGGSTPLTDGLGYVSYAGHIGGRVVYQACGVVYSPDDDIFIVTTCDVQSVNRDGSGVATLASHPANEAVQGFIGEHVVIRRTMAGKDQLIAVDSAGGPEHVITTVTDGEFVQLVADDLIILRRPSGTWSLDVSGIFMQLGPTPGDYGHAVVGNAICYNAGLALYCAPLDGSGPEVRIDRNGKIVGAL